MSKVESSNNDITEQDRACVNCEHYRREWRYRLNPIYVIAGEAHKVHRCARDGISTKTDPVTGKVTVTILTVPCYDVRADGWRCGAEGKNWEPSLAWQKRKENLLKIIKNN